MSRRCVGRYWSSASVALAAGMLLLLAAPPVNAWGDPAPSPASSLVVTTSVDVADMPPAGGVVTYTFTVVNGTATALTGLKVVNMSDVSGASSNVPCGLGVFAAGSSMTCQAIYTVTDADVARGYVTSTATAFGIVPGGAVVSSGPSGFRVAGKSAITLQVTADRKALVAGQTVTYSFTVTNTGAGPVDMLRMLYGATAYPLSACPVSDRDRAAGAPACAFTGTGLLPVAVCQAADVTELAPGTSTVCTASYVVTKADVARGELTLTSTALFEGVPARGSCTVTGPVGRACTDIGFSTISNPSTLTIPSSPLGNAGGDPAMSWPAALLILLVLFGGLTIVVKRRRLS